MTDKQGPEFYCAVKDQWASVSAREESMLNCNGVRFNFDTPGNPHITCKFPACAARDITLPGEGTAYQLAELLDRYLDNAKSLPRTYHLSNLPSILRDAATRLEHKLGGTGEED